MFSCFNALPTPLRLCLGMCLHQDVAEEFKKAKVRSSKMERDLHEHGSIENNVVKILMLGAPETGKSTIIKQIKIIHNHGFSKEELITFKPAVLDNLLTSMKTVLQGMGMLRINLANKQNKEHARSILACSQCLGDDQELLPFMAHAFCALWADQGVRAAAARGYEFELNDSALYFFENMSRIIAPNYIPTDTDVLRVRVRTRGIIETQFQVNKTVFRLYDVRGQQSVRRKWLRCFEGVQAVVFVVALNSYDKTLLDDPSVNQLLESLELFSSVCANTVFQGTTMGNAIVTGDDLKLEHRSELDRRFCIYWINNEILFMNKADLFREKILNSGRHLRLYHSSYKGADGDVDAAAHHITAIFSACNSSPGKPVYHHFTTAIDTASIQVAFHVVVDQVMSENLEAVKLV